jgi:hypothetical protein
LSTLRVSSGLGKEEQTMFAEGTKIDLQNEAEKLVASLEQGDSCASVHLARLIEADAKGALRPFAEALAARLWDHLARYNELGITDPNVTLEDEVYRLLKAAAIDWDGLPCQGRPGEEA